MNGRVNYMFNLIFTNDFSIDTIGNKEKYILSKGLPKATFLIT